MHFENIISLKISSNLNKPNNWTNISKTNCVNRNTNAIIRSTQLSQNISIGQQKRVNMLNKYSRLSFFLIVTFFQTFSRQKSRNSNQNWMGTRKNKEIKSLFFFGVDPLTHFGMTLEFYDPLYFPRFTSTILSNANLPIARIFICNKCSSFMNDSPLFSNHPSFLSPV